MKVEKNSPFLPDAYVYAFLIVPFRMFPICEYRESLAVDLVVVWMLRSPGTVREGVSRTSSEVKLDPFDLWSWGPPFLSPSEPCGGSTAGRAPAARRDARQGMPPPVFYAVPRTAANAALHPDVSYVTGSEPGNAEGKVVKYRALS